MYFSHICPEGKMKLWTRSLSGGNTEELFTEPTSNWTTLVIFIQSPFVSYNRQDLVGTVSSCSRIMVSSNK